MRTANGLNECDGGMVVAAESTGSTIDRRIRYMYESSPVSDLRNGGTTKLSGCGGSGEEKPVSIGGRYARFTGFAPERTGESRMAE